MSEQPPSDDPFDFAPVPTLRERHDGWTPERQRRFILVLAEHGGVSAAARAIGMTAQGANRLRKRAGAEGFARAWDAALSEGRLKAFDEAMRRGRDGYTSPILRNGKIVGYRQRFDNRLLFAACYGEPPSRYDRS